MKFNVRDLSLRSCRLRSCRLGTFLQDSCRLSIVALRSLSIFGVSGLLGACATYTDKSAEVRRALYSGNYDEALNKLDKSDIATSSSDKALYRMERGSILYLSGRYTGASADWSLASKRLEELYTTSISKQTASMAVNESYADYEGETHEKTLLPLFSALAYFANNQPEKAIVEVRRTYEILKVLNANGKNKNAYNRDAFAHFLSGMIYEARDEWDAAIVEYRSAVEAEQANKSFAGSATAKPFYEALGRLAEYRNRAELLAQVKKAYPTLTWTKQVDLNKMGEVYVVYESGRAPLKEPRDFPVPINGSVINISFPVYKQIYASSRTATVSVDGRPVGNTIVMQDIGSLAERSLEDRRGRDLIRMAARIFAKDQASRAAGRAFGPLAQLATSVVGAVTERADTRSWTSLPDTIQVLRVPIPAGKDVRILAQPNSDKPEEWVVKLNPGDKKLLRLRTFN